MWEGRALTRFNDVCPRLADEYTNGAVRVLLLMEPGRVLQLLVILDILPMVDIVDRLAITSILSFFPVSGIYICGIILSKSHPYLSLRDW